MKVGLMNICLIPVLIHQQRRSVYALASSNEVTRLKVKLGKLSPKSQHVDSLFPRNVKLNTMPNSQGYEISRQEHARYTETDIKRVQDMLYRVRECNKVPARMKGTVMDFVVDGRRVGKVTTPVADLLCKSSSSLPVFRIDRTGDTFFLTLAQTAGTTVQQRTDSVMSIMKKLKEKGIINGWRDELYPLSDGFYNEPLFFVERAAAPFLGMIQYGVHINGLVTSKNGEEKMWIARRSAKKSLYPGMTDQLVAGGQPAGLSLMENVLKECEEEAGISHALAMKGLKATGAVSYENVQEIAHDLNVVTRAVLFNFDLYLPSDFEPTIVDGEVEEFFQWSIEEQFASFAIDFNDPMKPNCYLCVIDYLLRKGEISPDTPGYLDVLRELKSGDCR
jgi:8-oxo-dGTP pyrophosphatase MutT (NUDIX family)